MSLRDKALEHLERITGMPLRVGLCQVLKMSVDINTDIAAISY